MSLLSLPPELLHHIAWSLDTDTDISHLAQSCWRIYAETIPILYKKNHLFHNNTALHWAVLQNVPETLYRARQAGIAISEAVPNLLHIASGAAAGADADAAAQDNSTKIINTLIREFGFNPSSSSHDINGYTPLLHAVKAGSIAAARILIARGADPSQPAANSTRETPLHAAAAANNPLLASLLLKHGSRVSPQLADFFCSENANANPELQHLLPGTTPLHIATRSSGSGSSSRNNIALVRLLLDHGADPTMAKLTAGMGPLHFALRNHNAAVARLLLERGADMSLAWGFGPEYAVYFAALHADFEMVKVLVEFGAPVNVPLAAAAAEHQQQEKQGTTDLSCLKMALVNRHVDMALFLVQAGADMVANGEDLVNLAIILGMEDVVEAMRRKRAVGRVVVTRKRSLTGLGRRLKYDFARWRRTNMAVKVCSG